MRTYKMDAGGNVAQLTAKPKGLGSKPKTLQKRSEEVKDSFSSPGISNALITPGNRKPGLVAHAPEALPPASNEEANMHSVVAKRTTRQIKEDLMLLAIEFCESHSRGEARYFGQLIDGIYKANETADFEEE